MPTTLQELIAEPLDRWVACGWAAPGWIAGRPCDKQKEHAAEYWGADALRKTFKHNIVTTSETSTSGKSSSITRPITISHVATTATGSSTVVAISLVRDIPKTPIIRVAASSISVGSSESKATPVLRSSGAANSSGKGIASLDLFTRSLLSIHASGGSFDAIDCQQIAHAQTSAFGSSKATIDTQTRLLISKVKMMTVVRGSGDSYSDPEQKIHLPRILDIAYAESELSKIIRAFELGNL